MLLRNRPERFGLIAVLFHWITALLFLGLVGVGFTMTRLDPTDPQMFALFQLHKSLGITMFLLIVLRLAWRGVNVTPLLPQGMPKLERFAAHATHWALYAGLLLMPLSGWVIVSASPFGIPTIFFGFIELPHLSFVIDSPNRAAIGKVASFFHWAAVWSLIGLVMLHAAAAFRHHLWLQDNVLRSMWFTRDLFEKETKQ